jgi:short subunit dehydrogenase-like uncharacterized protein
MIPDLKIMIIGGHGKVGQFITKELKNYSLILAGRNEEKMIVSVNPSENSRVMIFYSFIRK